VGWYVRVDKGRVGWDGMGWDGRDGRVEVGNSGLDDVI